jgi:arylsulfatase
MSFTLQAVIGGSLMLRRFWFALIACAGCALSVCAQSTPPNIVFILADDVGYSDLSCTGAEDISTPNIDQLAQDGVRFTSYYAPSPVCTPSRAAIMTGCYAPRVGLPSVLNPTDTTGLSSYEVTLPETLKRRGYVTGLMGKWHLGWQPQFNPTRHGFDYWFGLPYSNDFGAERHKGWPQLPLYRNEQVIELPAKLDNITERITQESIDFITKNKNKRFFLMISHVAAHTPWYVSDKFKGKSKAGPYGDFIQAMDWSVGEVVRTLHDLHLDGRTMIIFTSDNGPLNHPMPELEKLYGNAAKVTRADEFLRGGKNTTWEGGVRVPCIVKWDGITRTGRQVNELAAGIDWLPTLAHLAGSAAPNDRIIDGRDILPLIVDPFAKTPHDVFYFYRGNGLEAVRSGQWKLHLAHGGKNGVKENQLYNLDGDVREQNNVASEQPQVVADLEALAEQARDDLGDSYQNREGHNRRAPGHVEGTVLAPATLPSK